MSELEELRAEVERLRARADECDRCRGHARGDVIEDLALKGHTTPEIAKMLGVDKRTVNYWRKKRGVPGKRVYATGRTEYATPEQIVKLRELLADGASLAEAARTLGLNEGTVRNVHRGEGWTTEESIDHLTTLRRHGHALGTKGRASWT
ncbi:DNA binding protein [Mycobacterium phage Phabba]|uniref:Helix-turn-helix DNA binding domain protein n=1 Tax=Mycobacterium phage Phabba TaxID=2027899 RepID=A0A249XSC8_9CAUD|nr:DNA binding protein [Mycobacterium phage Phabba]ASZ74645.1 helix-turn-helix DNA binding domain protein [Mycobacterium phage Phabba]